MQRDAFHEYVGDYVAKEIDAVYHVTNDSKQLILNRLKHPPEDLNAMTPELFSADFGTVRFLRDGQRYISRMLISSDRVYNLRFRKERKAMAN